MTMCTLNSTRRHYVTTPISRLALGGFRGAPRDAEIRHDLAEMNFIFATTDEADVQALIGMVRELLGDGAETVGEALDALARMVLDMRRPGNDTSDPTERMTAEEAIRLLVKDCHASQPAMAG